MMSDVFPERPKAAVILTPVSRNIFRGESVTLRCEIPEGTDRNWDYSWYLKRDSNSPVASRQEYTIWSAADGDSGEYTCRGTQRATTQSSETSDVLRLTVSGKKMNCMHFLCGLLCCLCCLFNVYFNHTL